jgi:hypothetical protein
MGLRPTEETFGKRMFAEATEQTQGKEMQLLNF